MVCSHLVGPIICRILLEYDATITIIHQHTKNPQTFVKQADIVIVAIGNVLERITYILNG